MDVKQLAAAERRDLADLLETLTPAQWDAPSLCEGWTVRDVAAHVVSYEELSAGQVAGRFVKARLRFGRANALGVQEYAARGPEAIIALLRAHAVPRGITAGFGGRIGLTDATIHHQDIRRPLGLPREIPDERLRAVLDFLPRARVLPSPGNMRGLHLVATDLGWSRGNGPEVSGPAEALIMALAGRAVALPELSGAGVKRLAMRLE